MENIVAWYIREKDVVTIDAQWAKENPEMVEPLYLHPKLIKELVAWVVYSSADNDIVWTDKGKRLKQNTPLYTLSQVI